MSNKEIDPKTKQALEGLRSVPPRNPVQAARGKAEFLKQAAGMRLAVSREKENRHNRQSSTIFPAFPRKERVPMFNPLIAIVLALAVLFSGTVTTVFASQTSLPNQTLYPVKILSEDATLALNNNPQTQIQYNLDFADRRISEMTLLLSSSAAIPEEVITRLQNELDQALQLTAGLEDSQMRQQLEQIRQRAETQLQETNLLMFGAPQSDQPLLLRAQACIQEQVRLAALGESDPEEFRFQVRQRFQYRGGVDEKTPVSGNGPNEPSITPVPNGNGNGPEGGNSSSGTPGQYGPGSGSSQPTGTAGQSGPGSSSGQPAGTPGQYGAGSQSPTSTPQPGGGGNGGGSGNKP
jgi:hypothetical protein